MILPSSNFRTTLLNSLLQNLTILIPYSERFQMDFQPYGSASYNFRQKCQSSKNRILPVTLTDFFNPRYDSAPIQYSNRLDRLCHGSQLSL